MNIVSQRDPRWSNITLGTSGTIGQYGCTITSLGYLVGLTPDKVNERMNAVGGYANGNLVIWTKIQEAIGVTCYRYYGWDNQKVLDAISANGAVLGEVDGAAIGGTGKHWIVLTGNKMCQDPWTGKERPTSDFSFTGYTTVVFDKSKLGNYVNDNIYRDYDLTNKESMKVCVDDHIKVSEGFYVEKTQYESIKGQLTALTTQNEELGKKLGDTTASLTTANTALKTTQESLAKELASQHDWAEVAEKAQDERDIQRDFSESVLSQMENDLKITTSSSTKEERLAVILTTATSNAELENKYQNKITSLEDENSRLLLMTKPIAEMTVGQIILQLISSIFGGKNGTNSVPK